MNTYNFEIRHKKGDEMPVDYLSRHRVDALGDFHDTLYVEQQRDPLCTEINFFLKTVNIQHIALNKSKTK
jgi:hypothetical protein